jgi:uncharacterized membrane protein YgcG
MDAPSHPLPRRTLVQPRLAAPSLMAVLLALLAGLTFTAVADAAGAQRDSGSQASVTPLSPAQVETLVAGVPLRDLSTTELAEVLSQLPGLSAFPASTRKEALTKAIEGVAAKNGTLEKLAGSHELVSELKTKLEGLLLPAELLNLLKGEGLSETLTKALTSVSGREVLAEVLSSASNPAQTIDQALTAPTPNELETLVGSGLSGEPFTKTTVGELAETIGTSAPGLAEDFDTPSAQLPASAMALTTPLLDGKTLGVLDAVEGLDVGTLDFGQEGSGGGSGGGGSGGDSGGSGSGSGGSGGGSESTGRTGDQGNTGAADNGSAAAPTSMTIVLDGLYPQPSAVASSSAGAALTKVKIVSGKVKGDVVTLVLQVPAAGRLTVAGRDTKSVKKEARHAERLSLKVRLTKAVAASLRKHRRHLKVGLEASFKAVGGASSSARTSVMVV